MALLPLRHWYERGAVPVAVTENVTESKAVFVWLDGCIVIDGEVQEGCSKKLTVAVPVLLIGPQLEDDQV